MSALTKLAKNRPCLIRLMGCSGGGEDTVPAHYRDTSLGAGMGIKPDDLFVAHACFSCHDICDGRKRLEGYTRAEVRLAHALGVLRTIHWLMEHGHIQIGQRSKESA